MKYEIIGASIYDIPYIEDDAERNAHDERRAEEIDDAILDAMGTGEAVIRLWDGDRHYDTLTDGHNRRLAWSDLQDGIEALAIKEGVDLIRFSNGNLGEEEVARIKDEVSEDGE